MKPSEIAILCYAVLYFVLASDMEAGNISQRYPVIYVGLSMLDQILIVAGVVLFGLKAEADFAKFWRFLFPLMILERHHGASGAARPQAGGMGCAARHREGGPSMA
jgi:hypothetical protein